MTKIRGEEVFKQGFIFKTHVPLGEQVLLGDFLYKFAHNFLEARDYLQILELSDELDTAHISWLLFRIQGMALQCFALAMRRMTDDASKRSIRKLISRIIGGELGKTEVEDLKKIHSHFADFVDKGVAHQDQQSYWEVHAAFPNTDVIKKDVLHLENLYYRLVGQVCERCITIRQPMHSYKKKLERLLSPS